MLQLLLGFMTLCLVFTGIGKAFLKSSRSYEFTVIDLAWFVSAAVLAALFLGTLSFSLLTDSDGHLTSPVSVFVLLGIMLIGRVLDGAPTVIVVDWIRKRLSKIIG